LATVRIVLDTNILVRANPTVAPQGLARDLLLTTLSGPHTLILSPAILAEVRRVLAYPHVQARWLLTPETIEQYLAFLVAAGILVEPSPTPSHVVSDPDDDPILQTAISGRADVLCTRDVAFRQEVVDRVCRAHGIRILDDITLIQELRRESPT
jgi:putative PIN family toxin of toxin-antitoxin system